VHVELPTLGVELVDRGLGPFEVIEFIGAGRFAETYRVVRAGDEYVLKICHFIPRIPQELWESELESLRRVDHPNIMGFRTASHFEAEGRMYPFLEGEYIDGGDVKRRLADGWPPGDSEELRAFFAGLLRGVAELHDLNILHRDIRPENVALRGGDWRDPVLLDFGLAHPFVASAAQQRLPLAERRRDLAAVAEVVYEVGTGIPCGLRRSALTRPGRLRQQPPPDPSDLSSLFTTDVAELVVRLLTRGHRL
jgi:serine/threonine protein kinase